jgi:hypothetical protein
VGRLDGTVLPEVMARLQELLGDPRLGSTAENALNDIEIFQNRTSGPPVKNSYTKFTKKNPKNTTFNPRIT